MDQGEPPQLLDDTARCTLLLVQSNPPVLVEFPGHFEQITMFLVANGVDSDPSEFANFPCCLKYMPQLLGSCQALRVLGGGLGGGVGDGWVWGGVGWDNNVIGTFTHT